MILMVLSSLGGLLVLEPGSESRIHNSQVNLTDFVFLPHTYARYDSTI